MNTLAETSRPDPLRTHVELALAGTYYPGGFPVRFETNSRQVLDAAAEAWGRCAPEFDRTPIRFRVVVQPEGELAEQPAHRMQARLHSIVSDRYNFASLDLDGACGFIYVSERTASNHGHLRWYFLESAAYVLLSHRHVAAIHAACVVRNGQGLLLCGPSGAGKTTLSYACARARWTFVSDDATWLLLDSECRMALGQPRHARFRLDAPGLFPELAGYAVLTRPNGRIGMEVPLSEFPDVRTADRASIAAVIFLERGAGSPGARRLAGADSVERLLADLPSLGDPTDAMHERAVRRLEGAPAWRMQYTTLKEALEILETLPII